MLTEVRNHVLENFATCRRKFILKVDGWEANEPNDNLIIGSAVHAALAVWRVTGDEVRACQEGFAHCGKDDRIIEIVYNNLQGYFRRYATDLAAVVSTETEFSVPLTVVIDGVPVTLSVGNRIDGLQEYAGKVWVLETKTSGEAPGNFWKRYELNRQITQYYWASRIKFEIPLEGVIVDTIFKANQKNPIPKYERRYYKIEEERIQNWLFDTMQQIQDIARAFREGAFYKSWKCFSEYNSACEFLEYCSHDDRPEVLRSTHFQLAVPAGKSL